MKSSAEDVCAAMEGAPGDALAAVGAVAYTLFGDFSTDLDVLSLAACGAMPSPVVLSLVAVRELLCKWETARGSVATSWTAAVSRFQRLLLFSPQGPAGSSPLCRCRVNTKAAVATLSGGISVASRAARGAAEAPQQQDEVSTGEPPTRPLYGPLVCAARSQVSAVRTKAATAQQEERLIVGTSQRGEKLTAGSSQQGEKLLAGSPPLAPALAVAAQQEATAARVNRHAFSLARCTKRAGEGGPVTDDVNISSRSRTIESSFLPEKYQGPPGNKKSASSPPQESVTEWCFEETDSSTVLDRTPISVGAASSYLSSTEPDEAAYPCTNRQDVPSGLDMLAAFEDLLWQQKRLLHTGQLLPCDYQEQQRQLQQQIEEAVSRGLLRSQAERTKRATLLDWKDPYARPEWSDIILCYPEGGEDGAAQATSVPAVAPAEKTARQPCGAFAVVPRLQVTAQPADPVSDCKVTAEQPASRRGTPVARRVAADELSRRVALAIRGEVSGTDQSNTILDTEVYRPTLAAAAVAFEVNNLRSCAEATADALLRSGPLPARGNAERCSHVFCALDEVDGSLLMMQQQQIDCLRRIYGRIGQVVIRFLKKMLNVASLESAETHSCETLYYSEGDRSSCNGTDSLAHSPPVRGKHTKSAKCLPDGATLVLQGKNALRPASNSVCKAGNAAATTADTGGAARVISHFEILLGLHATCEALLQKSYCEDVSVPMRARSDVQEATAGGRAATAAERESQAVDIADRLPAATTERRQARVEGSAASPRRNENSLSLSKARELHQSCEPQRGSLLQPVTTTPFPAVAAGMRETSFDCREGISWGSNGKGTATSMKTEDNAAAMVNSRGADTDLPAGEAATASNGACSVSSSDASHRRRGSVFFGNPPAIHSSDVKNSRGNTPSVVPLLRRAALQHIHAVTAEILQTCGKLLQQLQYVDQAIQEALTSPTASDCSSRERKGIYMTAGDTPVEGTALSSFLKPLELPSAAAALRAIKVLQETIRKTP